MSENRQLKSKADQTERNVKNRMVERDFRVGRIVIGFDQANDK
jgi:hypothetical protein